MRMGFAFSFSLFQICSSFFHDELVNAISSSMFSTGGDELNTNCYDQDPETQQILKSTGQTLEQALDEFTKTTHGALEKLGKTPAVWEGRLVRQCS